MKIKKWDTVQVIAWGAKWKKWTVLDVFSKDNKVIIEWVNIKTKYRKTTTQNKWSMAKMEYPIDASNVMILDSKWKTSRVWYKVSKDWKKFRVAVSSWESLDKGFLRSK